MSPRSEPDSVAVTVDSEPARTPVPGRPWVDPDVPRRGREIKVRLTDEEHAELRRRCPKPRLAEWMREHCLGAAPARASRAAAAPATDPALLRQLAGAGNLLNQIARAVHRGEWGPADRVQILARLAVVERELQAVHDGASSDEGGSR